MTNPLERLVRDPTRALIYYQGLPVAVCLVAAREGESLQLICGPLCFKRDTRLLLHFLTPRVPFQMEAQRNGTVEGFDDDRMRIRLEPDSG